MFKSFVHSGITLKEILKIHVYNRKQLENLQTDFVSEISYLLSGNKFQISRADGSLQ